MRLRDYSDVRAAKLAGNFRWPRRRRHLLKAQDSDERHKHQRVYGDVQTKIDRALRAWRTTANANQIRSATPAIPPLASTSR